MNIFGTKRVISINRSNRL